MGPSDRGVDQTACPIDAQLEGPEDSLEVASLRPTGEAVVHGLPAPVPVRQIAPGRARLEHENHGVHEAAVSQLRTSPVAPNQWRDLLPLRIGDLVPMHSSQSLAGNANANFLPGPADEDGDEDEDEDDHEDGGAPYNRDTP